MIKNGIIIQNLSNLAFELPKFNGHYLGVNAFYTNPLLGIDDAACKDLRVLSIVLLLTRYFSLDLTD